MKDVVINNETLQVEKVPGYFFDETGVYKGDARSIEDKLSEFLFIESLIKHGSGIKVGICAWNRYERKLFREYFLASEFVAWPSTIINTLANRGLFIPYSKTKDLRVFLNDYLAVISTDRVFDSYSKTGWYETDQGKHVFVLPNQFIGGEVGGAVFMPETKTPFHQTIKQKGTLDEWREHVANKANGNPMLMTAIGVSFAAPLLHLLGQDGFCFHYVGESSTGKSITGQSAASVWGCGKAPTAGAYDSFVRCWNSTANAMEALAEAHNHIPLVIDEIGQSKAKDFGALVYMLANGAGKEAMNANRDLKAARSWLNCMISTGEDSVKHMIEETTGKPSKTGQNIRFIDFDVNEGLFPAVAKELAGAYADAVRDACANYYGTAGDQYLRYLVEKLNGDGDYKAVLMGVFKSVYERLIGMNPKFVPAQQRAMKRFAIVETALILAKDAGCVDYTAAEIKRNVILAVEKWIKTMPLVSLADRAYEKLRDFVLMNGHKIRHIGCGDRSFTETFGFYHKSDGCYYFTDKMFRKVLEVGNTTPVLEQLNRDGFLDKNNGADHLKKRVLIEGSRIYVIAIHERFFNAIEDIQQNIVAEPAKTDGDSTSVSLPRVEAQDSAKEHPREDVMAQMPRRNPKIVVSDPNRPLVKPPF